MSNRKTLLLDISGDGVSTQKSVELDKLKDFELIEHYKDIDNNLERRKLIINELKKRDVLLVMECVNNLTSGYLFGSSNHIKKLLVELVKNEDLNFSYRILIIQSLESSQQPSQEMKDKLVKECEDLYIYLFDVVYTTLEYKQQHDVSTTFFWDIFKTVLTRNSLKQKLESNETFFDKIMNVSSAILLDSRLDEEYRYKLLVSLTKAEITPVFTKMNCEIFIKQKLKDYKYYIFILQILKNKEMLTHNHLEILKKVLQEYELTVNAQADICDFFLSLQTPQFLEFVNFGKKSLDNISFDVMESGMLKTFYSNGQNIHKIDVEQSITPFIEKIINFDFHNLEEDGEEIQKIIISLKLFAQENNFTNEDGEKIQHSIKRFILDNTLYSQYSVSLLNLLIRCYYYIQTREDDKHELMKRMCEELADMSHTCTTGHIYRLVNIFSGYDVEMKIPVEEEIKGCVFARLTKIIESKDEDIQLEIWDSIGDAEEVAEEKFYKLLGKDISTMCDELKKEYVEQSIIEEDQLNLYTRKCISLFQLGERI